MIDLKVVEDFLKSFPNEGKYVVKDEEIEKMLQHDGIKYGTPETLFIKDFLEFPERDIKNILGFYLSLRPVQNYEYMSNESKIRILEKIESRFLKNEIKEPDYRRFFNFSTYPESKRLFVVTNKSITERTRFISKETEKKVLFLYQELTRLILRESLGMEKNFVEKFYTLIGELCNLDTSHFSWNASELRYFLKESTLNKKENPERLKKILQSFYQENKEGYFSKNYLHMDYFKEYLYLLSPTEAKMIVENYKKSLEKEILTYTSNENPNRDTLNATFNLKKKIQTVNSLFDLLKEKEG